MNSFRTLFGFNNQLIQFLRVNPLNLVLEAADGKGALWLGNIYAAYSTEILEKHNISAVLTVAAGTGLKYKEEQSIKHMIILADDVEHYNLSRHFDKMIDFIKAHRDEGRNVLVHCFAGISRSATTVIAYMMRELGHTYRRAFQIVKGRRKEINPNNGFVRQLQAYEKKVKANAPPGEQENSNRATRSQSQNKSGPAGALAVGSTAKKMGAIQPSTTLAAAAAQSIAPFQSMVMNGNRMTLGKNPAQQQQQQQQQGVAATGAITTANASQANPQSPPQSENTAPVESAKSVAPETPAKTPASAQGSKLIAAGGAAAGVSAEKTSALKSAYQGATGASAIQAAGKDSSKINQQRMGPYARQLQYKKMQ